MKNVTFILFLDLFLCSQHVCQTLYKHAVRRMPCIKKLRRAAIIKDDTFIEILFLTPEVSKHSAAFKVDMYIHHDNST
jgi:hypothetical protein